MANYSALNNDLWSKVEPLLDNYAKFYWDDELMTKYHAFIINEKKGSLKFYNGPSFSNNYTKPQFESASTRFSGVTFNTQQITFTIAVYAVTIEEYRQLIYKLHPYTIANLIFGFDDKWRYIVKLAKREDSTRYIIGKNSNGKDLYYTELKLTFEVQGDAVAHSVAELDYTPSEEKELIDIQDTSKNIKYREITFQKNGIYSKSDLETPFLLTFNVSNFTNSLSTVHAVIQLKLSEQPEHVHTLDLFNISFTNSNNEKSYLLEYNSQTGDLCLLVGNDRKIITLLTTYSSGKRIISSITTNKMMLPGSFDGYNWERIKIIIYYNNCSIDLDSAEGYGINCYARTNLI